MLLVRAVALACVLLCLQNHLFAQTAIIRGKVFDAATGEGLIGADVTLDGTALGTSTDLDGNYSLENIPSGTYTLQASYLTHETQKITGVELKPGDVKVINIKLYEKVDTTEVVVIEIKKINNTETALLTQQEKSSVIQDGISNEQMGKAGDSDAGAVMRRVTGVSVEGGKYVYVRGLGDRYSKTYLNNAEIPGLDPNRNSVQMDLFPANLIDNVVVYKTFSPELPGSFTGGFINITTRDFPEKYTFSFNNSFRYNTQATFNKEFLSYEGGKTDWLGFDDGSRDIPDAAKQLNDKLVTQAAGGNAQALNTIDQGTKSFNKIIEPSFKTPFLDQRHSISVGNQKKLFKKPLGYIAGLSYQRTYEYYKDGTIGRYSITGQDVEELNPQFVLKDSRGTESILWGALFNTSYKLNDKNKIGFNLIRNQSARTLSRMQSGMWDNNGAFSPNNIYVSSTLQFLQRSFTSGQLRGEHAITKLNDTKVRWLSSYTISKQDEPDLRFFTYDYIATPSDTTYNIDLAAYVDPSRFYRYMRESNFDNKIDVEVPFKQWNELPARLKFGSAFVRKYRTFEEQRYDYVPGPEAQNFNGNISDYLSDDNIGKVNGGLGLYLQDNFQPSNNYTGEEQVFGSYVMTDIPLTKKLSVATGVRMEKTYLIVESENEDLKAGILDNVDFLPAANFKYELKEGMNMRASYGKTLARPTFRELAPFSSYNFTADAVEVGNPNLKRTLVDNFDLRWEYFSRPGEIFAVSAFYKSFSNPIERVFSPQATNEITWRNVESAQVMGMEFEVRKSLDFVKSLKNFKIGVNLSLVRSKVDIPPLELEKIRSIDKDAENTRPMYAQSPYMLNSYLSYDNDSLGLAVNLVFNIFGERLTTVSQGGLPNVFEQPRGSMDLTVFYNLSERFVLTAQGRNLLNPQFRQVHSFKGKEYVFESFRLGRVVSLGLNYGF